MEKEETKRGFRKIGWWIILLVIVFFLILGSSKGWEWFSPTHTWSDIAILVQEIEEKTQKLNQILQEALQSVREKESPSEP